MHVTLLYSIILSLFLPFLLQAWEPGMVNERLKQQIFEYDPTHKDDYYTSQIPFGTFLKFLDIYKRRPIKDNYAGIRSQGMFFLWFSNCASSQQIFLSS